MSLSVREKVERRLRTIDVEVNNRVNLQLRDDSRALALKLKNRGSFDAFCRNVLTSWTVLGLAIVLGVGVGAASGLFWMANTPATGCRTADSLCYELRYMGRWVNWQFERWF